MCSAFSTTKLQIPTPIVSCSRTYIVLEQQLWVYHQELDRESRSESVGANMVNPQIVRFFCWWVGKFLGRMRKFRLFRVICGCSLLRLTSAVPYQLCLTGSCLLSAFRFLEFQRMDSVSLLRFLSADVHAAV